MDIQELITRADELAKEQDATYQQRLSGTRSGPAPGQEDWFSPAAEGNLTPVPEPDREPEFELTVG